MLKTFEEAAQWINEGRILHIAGNGSLLGKLPKGNWIGGSTEYFMTNKGGLISGSLLFVTEFSNETFSIRDYGIDTISRVMIDAYDNGFSIIVIPFDCEVHNEYARNAAEYEGMFIKNIAGWISGTNMNTPGQIPIAINGQTGEVLTDRAAVLHLEEPKSKTVDVGIINIHEQDKQSPVIEFDKNEITAISTCRINGKEMLLADYIRQSGHDLRIPMVGDYYGHGVNVAFRSVEATVVHLFAPVFSGIKYRFAKAAPDYAAAFQEQLNKLKNEHVVFSCNCVLNFMFGEMEGKNCGTFCGPITFGEVAYQQLTQTLVYVMVA